MLLDPANLPVHCSSGTCAFSAKPPRSRTIWQKAAVAHVHGHSLILGQRPCQQITGITLHAFPWNSWCPKSVLVGSSKPYLLHQLRVVHLRLCEVTQSSRDSSRTLFRKSVTSEEVTDLLKNSPSPDGALHTGPNGHQERSKPKFIMISNHL